jgi:hypothetical protein
MSETNASNASYLDALVAAIRNDPVVGRNTCSVIDECYAAGELAHALHAYGVMTIPEALRWARDVEKRQLERALDCRWGDEDDVEVRIYADFKRRCEEFPLAD